MKTMLPKYCSKAVATRARAAILIVATAFFAGGAGKLFLGPIGCAMT